VTVNDRGPFIRGRDLDLSYGAAKKIGIVKKGVGRVKIELVP
jgi:rare lipoprotein A